MKKSTKIATSAVAAVAAAAGIYLGVTGEGDSIGSTIGNALGITKARTTAVDNTINWEELIPNIDSYLPTLPTINVPTVEIATVDLDAYLSPEATKVPTIELSTPEIEEITITVPKAEYDFNESILKSMEKMKTLQAVFKDQRRIQHDRTVLSNEYVDAWLKIYSDYANYSTKKIAMTKPFRMISEVMLPKNTAGFSTLRTNLEYYKSRGYDSALVVFDGSESATDLRNLAKYVRYYGLDCYFAFGGEESLNVSIFADPVKLKAQLGALAEYSSGFIVGWRSTSAHLLEQDAAYTNYLVSYVREANPNCLIFGEVYYGNTATYPHANQWGFGFNLPSYSSAVMICNFGFSSVNVEAVVKKLIPSKVGNMDQVAVITGHKPYYLTSHRNGLSQEVNQEIKEKLEKKFIAAGCKGTITLHDDGKNGIGGYRINNNLSETVYTDLK